MPGPLHTAIIQKAIEEIEQQNFGVTQQFLEIHQVVYADSKPVAARVDAESKDGYAIVYFPVVKQKFYLAVYVDIVPEVSVRWVGTESYNCAYFRADSDIFSFQQLSAFTTLQSTGGKNKGDKKRKDGGSEVVWKESSIFFEPNKEPDEFEDKLKKLLDYLETDKEGVAKLVEQAGGYIQVAIDFHDGNGMLGGPHIGIASLKRMAALNLEINFDLYASGEGYK